MIYEFRALRFGFNHYGSGVCVCVCVYDTHSLSYSHSHSPSPSLLSSLFSLFSSLFSLLSSLFLSFSLYLSLSLFLSRATFTRFFRVIIQNTNHRSLAQNTLPEACLHRHLLTIMKCVVSEDWAALPPSEKTQDSALQPCPTRAHFLEAPEAAHQAGHSSREMHRGRAFDDQP